MFNLFEKLYSISSICHGALSLQATSENRFTQSVVAEDGILFKACFHSKAGMKILANRLFFTALLVSGLSTGEQAKAAMNESYIGYVGCSMTVDAVDGYLNLGGTSLWPSAGESYFSGGVTTWASNLNNVSNYWAWFQGALNTHPDTPIIWWELCARADIDGDDQTLLEDARTVRDEIKRRAPNATIYVSAQPSYYQPGSTVEPVCSIAGGDGPTRMWELAAKLVADGGVEQGPGIGPLTPDLIQEDGCHANTDGELLMGGQLTEFFGGGIVDDRDGDGIIDRLDNCPTVSNPGQIDTDGNGIGDPCESTVFSLISVSPTAIPLGASTEVALTGQGFEPGMKINILPFNAGLKVNWFYVQSATNAIVVISALPNALAGFRGLELVKPNGRSISMPRAFIVQ